MSDLSPDARRRTHEDGTAGEPAVGLSMKATELDTEYHSPRFEGLETWPRSDILKTLLSGQLNALHAVSDALAELEAAVSASAKRLAGERGRIIYVGAGTSGRLAALDGIELVPTFGWPDKRLAYLFAGGVEGFRSAREGAEDDADAGRNSMLKLVPDQNDVVLGLAASGNTPYTIAAIEAAAQAGALTIGFANNPGSLLLEASEIAILLRSGEEVLAGSTRLAAGTSQKIALNLFSTSLMIALNRVYRGQMVDMQPTNAKLRRRAEIMVMKLTGCDLAQAKAGLAASGSNVKIAVLCVAGLSKTQAVKRLDSTKGDLGAALKSL